MTFDLLQLYKKGAGLVESHVSRVYTQYSAVALVQ